MNIWINRIWRFNEKIKYLFLFGFFGLYLIPFIIFVITEVRIYEVYMWQNFSFAEGLMPELSSNQELILWIDSGLKKYIQTDIWKSGRIWYLLTAISWAYAYLSENSYPK
jgi:hypothetical protein